MTTTSTAARTVDAETLTSWTRHTAGADAAPMVIDVRSAAEYETVHIRGSYHVPAQTLAEHTSELAHRLGA